ncbi:hypothetical protein PCANC_10015 [Puccinia coronata f. sp. avenae]|nr:hypothetical protein PCANC_10015 [Puccinia coronata f. sp. avenae]
MWVKRQTLPGRPSNSMYRNSTYARITVREPLPPIHVSANDFNTEAFKNMISMHLCQHITTPPIWLQLHKADANQAIKWTLTICKVQTWSQTGQGTTPFDKFFVALMSFTPASQITVEAVMDRPVQNSRPPASKDSPSEHNSKHLSCYCETKSAQAPFLRKRAKSKPYDPCSHKFPRMMVPEVAIDMESFWDLCHIPPD